MFSKGSDLVSAQKMFSMMYISTDVIQSVCSALLRLCMFFGGLIIFCARCVQASNDGATPAYIAAQSGFSKCIDVLASLGADLKKGDNKGQTPMHQVEMLQDSCFRLRFVGLKWRYCD
jgi:hypothetical protein